MGEIIIQIKRLLKIKWKQSDTHNAAKTSRVQEKASSKKECSSDKSLNTQGSGSRFEGGREYTEKENVQYILPKDVQEQDRLHQQHWMIKVAFQGNFDAPIEEALKKGITVLDSGCGPGTWVLDMAEAYPNSMFHGMDMAPVFPEQIKPPNCEFRLGNLNEKLPYPDNYFDYVHQRFVVAGLTAAGWQNALSELFRVLKPGGWVELKEFQMKYDYVGPLGEKLINTLVQIFNSKGFLPDFACDLGSFLEKGGFEDVSNSKLNIPVNHGGILGTLYWSDSIEGLKSLRPLLAVVDPESYGDENFEKTVEATGAEFAEYESLSNWYSAWGRKPLA